MDVSSSLRKVPNRIHGHSILAGHRRASGLPAIGARLDIAISRLNSLISPPHFQLVQALPGQVLRSAQLGSHLRLCLHNDARCRYRDSDLPHNAHTQEDGEMQERKKWFFSSLAVCDGMLTSS